MLAGFNWVAVREPKLSYYNKETLLASTLDPEPYFLQSLPMMVYNNLK